MLNMGYLNIEKNTRYADTSNELNGAINNAFELPTLFMTDGNPKNDDNPILVSHVNDSEIIYKLRDGARLRNLIMEEANCEQTPCLYDSPNFIPATDKELTAAICSVPQEAYENPLKSISSGFFVFIKSNAAKELSNIPAHLLYEFLENIQDSCIENGRVHLLADWLLGKICKYKQDGIVLSPTEMAHCISSAALACEIIRESTLNKMSATILKYKRQLRKLGGDNCSGEYYALILKRANTELEGLENQHLEFSGVYNILRKMATTLSAEISPAKISIYTGNPIEDLTPSIEEKAKKCKSDQACLDELKELELDEQFYLKIRDNVDRKDPLGDIAAVIKDMEGMVKELKGAAGTTEYRIEVKKKDLLRFDPMIVKQTISEISNTLKGFAIKEKRFEILCTKVLEALSSETKDPILMEPTTNYTLPLRA
ncbi:uncharacterized protein NEMAJ01_0532 [Nematocida major]|uniref:uncharacterized protein n=1 Tax=Nematocida major TaxID=1912982 RepID=UPI00200892B2|nr:uncharacterized protein NEMAJ01_0532 [Nematocida major]KAH9385636.1 hypothetical protein NEMAJ01_0532 [Nematocida major]